MLKDLGIHKIINILGGGGGGRNGTVAVFPCLALGGQVSGFLCHQKVACFVCVCVVLVQGFHMTLGAGDLNIKPDGWGL